MFSRPGPESPPRRREKGFAFLVVVLLTALVSGIGAALLVMSNTEHLITANERNARKALYASRAGLEYGYYLLARGIVRPGVGGAPFDSFDSAVREALDGAAFTGTLTRAPSAQGRGQVYVIESTGTFQRGISTTEMVVEMVPAPLQHGYVGFGRVDIHKHDNGFTGPEFRLESTIFSNGPVNVPNNYTVDGSIVSATDVRLSPGSVVTGDLVANAITNGGTIQGDARTVCAVSPLPDGAAGYDRVDIEGKRYEWFAGSNSPGGVGGYGPVWGEEASYFIRNGDEFNCNLFRSDGRLLAAPDVNVVMYSPPPTLDYAAMKAEAERYEPTYFPSMTAAMSYLAGKKVTEVISGKTVTTIKVGNDVFPEFLYVRGDFTLTLDPTLPTDNLARGVLKADGFHLEGGIYATGTIELHGPAWDPALHPAPPAWQQFRISALPYCYPALIAYQEPSSGSIDTWTPEDTPVMDGSGSRLLISSSASREGPVHITGVTYSQADTHIHHTADSEPIRFVGAELAHVIHNCNRLWFTFDPGVRCTRFLVSEEESRPQVLSYREKPR